MARLLDTDLFSYNDETGLVGTTGQSAVSNLLADDTGGGGGSGVSLVETNYAEYVVRVSSNQTGANIFVNGVNTQKTTPENISVTKAQLLSGDVEITVSKEGFSNLEKYVLILSVLDNSVVINNSRFDQPLGLSTADVIIQYFVGNTKQPLPTLIKNGNFIFTDFTLSKTRILPTDSNLLLFNVFVAGVTNSVLVNKNGQVDLYPALGGNNYGDIKGTLFSIKSSDAKLYRITEIVVEGEGEAVETLTANEDESLNINLTLNKSYSIKIQTEELRQPLPALDPKVSLLDSDPRTYNINSKVGVPLVIRKNSDVKAITVVVGENIFEFDTLDEGDIAGVTIPHSAFRGLGQYSVKIYPFSLKKYETQVRPASTPFVVKQNVKNIKTSVVEVSEVVESTPPKQFITPYELPTLAFIPTTPIVRGGGGGGIVALDRDFGSGFGVERVVDRTLLRNENIQ